ncbi:wall-associated receptor kinase-like 22 [Lotus japonicus]|uniref:wall-associated receptor kinase-like 22 n=1 Tax=Lotus japonicus TaxID=34305 RepID=UPI0025874E30|nr:wall-associated receptor kinase-like 22 [Lotus japonicus]
MFLQLSSYMIVLIIVSMSPLASAQLDYPDTVNPDCNSRCGGVWIAYPFGMGDPKCYADKWFEIECRNTSRQGSKPYLKWINLEITNIDSGSSYLYIMNPVFRWNCNKSSDAKPEVNLTGSPFVYSKDRNKFTAIGCNKMAYLQSNGSKVSGCVSLCDQYDDREASINMANDGCLGRLCCETSLPSFLVEFNVTLEDMKSNDNESGGDRCSQALIGTRNWNRVYLGSDNEYRSILDLDEDYVPAILSWAVFNSSSFKRPSDANCTDGSLTFLATDRVPAWICECYTGFYGNPYIDHGCIASQGNFNKNNRAKKWAIVGVSSGLGSIIFILGLWFLYKFVRKRMIEKRKQKFFKKNGGMLLKQRMSSGEVNVDKGILFSLRDLKKATDNFNTNRVLGKGGQGTVYKGMLVDGRIVAVKKFKVEGNIEEFINEFVILSQINNRNVVKLLGCCLETEIPLLIYEFIPNGNLFQYLHDQNKDLKVTWDMRLRIAIEIAGALFYLHSIASQPIYHRDVKSTNILLDEKYRAKLADFGASRIISVEATHLTTVVQGTFGYLDPEYFHTSQFTEKSDVYSFGVVLAEILTCQKAVSFARPGESKNLASYFVQCMEDNSLFDIVDKRITKEGKREHVIAVANLVKRCLELNGRKRPTMKEVTLELEDIRKLERKSSNAEQNHEEVEVVGIEDYQQPWTGYSTTSISFPTLSSETFSLDSGTMHIVESE